MQVELVDFISVPTRNTARAIAWYRDVLGLPDGEATEGEIETPNVTLSFWEPEREKLPFVANEAGFALRVADVAVARAEFEARGSSSSLRRRGIPGSATSRRSATPTGNTFRSSTDATRPGAEHGPRELNARMALAGGGQADSSSCFSNRPGSSNGPITARFRRFSRTMSCAIRWMSSIVTAS